MDPLADVMKQMGAQMGPPPGKAPTIGALAFDKRFAGTGPGFTQSYPLDDEAYIQALIRRQQMINAMEGRPNDIPLLGEIAAPMLSLPR